MTALPARPQLDAAGKPPIVRAPAQLAHALDEAVAFGHRIERRRRAHLHRELAAVLDRIDRDDLARADDAAGLNGAEADGPGAEDDDVAAGLEAHVGVTGGKSRRQLIAEQASAARPAESVNTGTQYSSNAVMISLMPPMPACAYTGVPSGISANGGNASTPGAFEKNVNWQ